MKYIFGTFGALFILGVFLTASFNNTVLQEIVIMIVILIGVVMLGVGAILSKIDEFKNALGRPQVVTQWPTQKQKEEIIELEEYVSG